MEISKQLAMFNNLSKSCLDDEISNLLESISMQDLAQKVLEGDYTISEDYDRTMDLYNLISFLQYVYNNTTLIEPVTNELYDSLYQSYVDETGHNIVGSSAISSDKKTGYHKYPHLRGSLDKVHYIRKQDVPKGDKRKSLEEWLEKSLSYLIGSSTLMKSRFKFDGVSLIFECDQYKTILRVLTRGDTLQNLAQDVTNTFKGYSFEDIFGDLFVDVIFSSNFAIKTECLMTHDNFMRYNDEKGLSLKNTRSAIISFMNTEEHEKDDIQYITVEPLEISSDKPLEWGTDHISLVSLTDTNDTRNDYVVFEEYDSGETITVFPGILSTEDGYNNIKTTIDNVLNVVEDGTLSEPIDGVVFTLCDVDLVKKLGRKENINKFQVAFKFPAGIKKTKVNNVKFQVGLMGGVTPVVEFDPIIVMGAKLRNSSTGSLNVLKNLDLNIGDEVIIKYDIIPVIMKDSTCAKGTGLKVELPTRCPICNELLTIDGLNTFCRNEDCNSRVVGKIINYTNKLDIKNIGKETISEFVAEEILTTIGDLYRLPQVIDKILALRGYKETKVNKIIASIYAKTKLYPHEFLGSLGIPGIGRRVMKTVCSEIDFKDLIDSESTGMIRRLTSIKGIKDKTATKILEGIDKNSTLIKDLMTYITILPYEDTPEVEYVETVLFTSVSRDKDFEKFLEMNNIEVSGSYSKKVQTLITGDKNPETKSSKLKKAEKDGIRILTMEEAKQLYGYV